ncbi:Sec-independent protein translocase protein TatB [Alishewanella sp. 16-MA]|uniref:Sec-independent protein translocase protein TatB n=1 Tax=Alishewanella maricola TaxID=2795740 RepID=A0ABS8C4Q1_9ALTE|nr:MULTISPECIES: Sec-independent protein translocase protein TatB [Alishewanella]MDP4945641.1 Sec-independent protein translocase protein TatB [Alishewanella sp.]MCB5227291.1 Sec-independent protein translocase protein TatB [Alishewanella maricola]MDP5035000.1 Sec-independent protein translocase protein TatB [Alishewanella sp.]MDP5186896.1 Sec-independent protein translocase protein TatB [Alishewanella sp.]MDP5460574.1 Sec-independent protein translocase protein TatB [Alishewanella sp. SMS8]
MGFWELLVIAIVALLVLGPERLPGAIRSTMKTVRSVKQFGQQMQAELSDNLRIHELHQKLKDAEAKNLLNLSDDEKAAIKELTEAANSVRPSNAQMSLNNLTQQLGKDLTPTSSETVVKDENKTGS